MRKIALAALAFFSLPAFAGFEQCAAVFPNSQPVVLGQYPASSLVRELCFDSFAVLHHGQRKTAIYAVEKLNRDILMDSKDEKRTDKFYEEARLPKNQRAVLSDYAKSGFDRGHLVPAAGRPNPNAMAQSFSLANMIPQAPALNRGLWAKIEEDTRKYAMRSGADVFVFTGPLYAGTTQSIGNGVEVPSHVYKLVFDSAKNKAWVFLVENKDDAKLSRISYSAFVQATGLELLGRNQPSF